MTLRTVKNSIVDFPAGKCVKEGLKLSEPVMYVHNGKIIDNFIVYSYNRTDRTISSPISVFGICFDDKEQIYYEEDASKVFGDSKDLFPAPDMSGVTMETYTKYEEAYSKARDILLKDYTEEETKKIINEYNDYLNLFLPSSFKPFFDKMFSLIK